MNQTPPPEDPAFDPKRRRLLAGLAASASGAVIGGRAAEAAIRNALPAPEQSGIDHIVVVMMENRSFDHFLGWVPGAVGRQAGLTFKDSNGEVHNTFNLAPNFQNCESADPDHSYGGARTQINGGAMDSFLLTQPVGDTFPIGYYTGDALPFYQGCANSWTICDHYFSGILSSTWPNRIYMHAGQTDRVDNHFFFSQLPTIWDSLASVGVEGRYYFNDVPFTALWGTKYLPISHLYPRFKLDAKLGKLAAVSYIDPAMLGEGAGVSRDDHPFADVRDGQAFLNDVYETLRSSPNWDRTLMIVNYDEWGGFYDHVEPPFAPVGDAEFQATGNDGRLGIRVPCIAIGPRARRKAVVNQQFDPNSILNMIAWRFGFAPLGARASSANFALALDFDAAPNYYAPTFSVPEGPFGGVCSPSVIPKGEAQEVLRRRVEHIAELQHLRHTAHQLGFKV